MILFCTAISLKELVANSGICHEDMTGKRGGECCGSEYKYCRNEYIPSSYGIFIFWWENTFITPLLMMSLCYITNNVINPCSKTINKCTLGSEVHNTARFQ